MSSQTEPCTNCKSWMAYAGGILGASLIVAGLVWAMRHYTQVAPLNANRAAERAAALKELRSSESDTLQTVAWIDKSKGMVRLPIEVAKELAVKLWQNPAAARAELISRQEKASFVPPPPAPKPSAFE